MSTLSHKLQPAFAPPLLPASLIPNWPIFSLFERFGFQVNAARTAMFLSSALSFSFSEVILARHGTFQSYGTYSTCDLDFIELFQPGTRNWIRESPSWEPWIFFWLSCTRYVQTPRRIMSMWISYIKKLSTAWSFICVVFTCKSKNSGSEPCGRVLKGRAISEFRFFI